MRDNDTAQHEEQVDEKQPLRVDPVDAGKARERVIIGRSTEVREVKENGDAERRQPPESVERGEAVVVCSGHLTLVRGRGADTSSAGVRVDVVTPAGLSSLSRLELI